MIKLSDHICELNLKNIKEAIITYEKQITPKVDKNEKKEAIKIKEKF